MKKDEVALQEDLTVAQQNAKMYNGFKEELHKLDPKHFTEIMQNVNPEVKIDVKTVKDFIDGMSQEEMHKVADHLGKLHQMPDGTAKDVAVANSKMKINESELSEIFGDILTEETQDKVVALFEAKVNDTIEVIAEEIEAEYAELFEESLEEILDQVDKYVTHVAQEYVAENQVAIQNSMKVEIAEEFIEAIKDLCEDYNIDVSDEKLDIAEAMQQDIDELSEAVQALLDKNAILSEELEIMQKTEVIHSLSEDLSDSETEKLVALLEGVSYENAETYANRVKIIKDKYFGDTAATDSLNEDVVLTQVESKTVAVDPVISAAAALMQKKK